MKNSRGTKLAVLSVGVLSLVGCSGDFNSSSTTSGDALGLARFDMNKFAINKLVCNPFQTLANDDVSTLDGGLQASLYYLRPNQPRYTSVGDMIQNGVASGKNLFFTNIDVPTRMFNLGFPLESGGMVKNDEGADLIEYFALRMTGSLGLAPDEAEGQYELAMLADDGVIWTNTSDAALNPVLVNNDGDHSTKFACGQVVNMSRLDRIPSRIDYYQGPRDHIALVPMWRKVEPGTQVGQDPLCNQLGNTLYFDPNNASKQQQAYKDLLSRGWKALRAENWKLPDGTGPNPCYEQGEMPQIFDLALDLGSEGTLSVSWKTNIPSTSQVLYKNTTEGTEGLTVSDNVLRVRHSVIIKGLKVGDFYDVHAISVSDSMGRTMSPAARLIVQ